MFRPTEILRFDVSEIAIKLDKLGPMVVGSFLFKSFLNVLDHFGDGASADVAHPCLVEL
jgi:hypothetical protein